MRTIIATLALVISAITTAQAFQSYQSKIPNGANVPNAPGVGHVSSGGGGSRNAFGTAFAAAGRTWTNALCTADSDGDGQSNGFELGDPDCVWTEGATPARTSDISHPGLASSTTAATTTVTVPGTTATTTAGSTTAVGSTTTFSSTTTVSSSPTAPTTTVTIPGFTTATPEPSVESSDSGVAGVRLATMTIILLALIA